MKLKRILYEINIKLGGGDKIFYPLYNSAIIYYMKKLGINVPIQVSFYKARRSNNMFGHITPNKPTNLKIENSTPSLILRMIAHEITHSKQFLKKELTIQNGNLYWFDDPIISVDEYSKFIEYNDKYKNLPFEKEAFTNEEKLRNEFLNSEDYITAMDSNPTLKYIKDNNLL
jgi:hypothetical protein